ncbi:MAG TPA: PIN domain-containing protein [Thermoanaerobaculia bacterium]|nr:PIN domain-containing protein [Thermoanaerobaculia bacterium]
MGLNERLAADSNAVIDWIREGGAAAAALREYATILLPLPVLGELFTGAYSSERKTDNIAAIERVISGWTILSPDAETAREYGRVRARLREMPKINQTRLNDLWIAALCIQHSVPLLTNDRGFDVIAGLTVIRW